MVNHQLSMLNMLVYEEMRPKKSGAFPKATVMIIGGWRPEMTASYS